MHTQEEILALWRACAVRPTKTRQALARLFASTRAPLSVPDILIALCAEGLKVNKTTIYRELERMQRLGIVASTQLGDRKQYYELALRDHHHHLVCLRCEHIEDIDVNEAELLREERKAGIQKQFMVLRHSLEFFGLCQQCQV